MGLNDVLISIPWGLGTVICVVLLILFTVTGIVLVRTRIGIHRLKGHHDVAGYVFCNLGVLYSVLLGFTVVNVQQRFDRVKATVEVEAGYLVELYRDAEVFQEKDREKIRDGIVKYIHNVLEIEWPEMQKGQATFRSSGIFKELWHSYYQVEPQSINEQVWYAESVRKLNDLMNVRMQRLFGSRESLGFEMWSLLIMGAFVMAAFLSFFGLESLTSHVLMASLLAASISFLLFLIFSLDTVFAGGVSVAPEIFEKVLESFQVKM